MSFFEKNELYKLKNDLMFGITELGAYSNICFTETDFTIEYTIEKHNDKNYYYFYTLFVDDNDEEGAKFIFIGFKSFKRFYDYMVFQHLKD